MKLIHNNPYRIIGVYAGATAREIDRQKSKINALLKIGKELQFNTDFKGLENPDRSEDTIINAFSAIQLNKDKVIHSYFWYINQNHIDDTALEYLKDGDFEKALLIWKKATDGKQMSKRNYSSFSNLGTLQIQRAYNGSFITSEFLSGVSRKIHLIRSEYLNDYINYIADDTYFINNDQELINFIDSIINEISKNSNLEKGLSNKIAMEMCQFDPIIKDHISKSISEEPKHKIEKSLSKSKSQRTSLPDNSYSYAIELYKSITPDLLILRNFLGGNDIGYQIVADKVANEVLQCGIDCFNRHHNEEFNYTALYESSLGKDIIELIKIAEDIVKGQQVKDRIRENKEVIVEWIDSAEERKELRKIETDLEFITQKIDRFQAMSNSVHEASNLILSCKPRLLNIKNALGGYDEVYQKLSTAVVGNAMGMLVDSVNLAQKMTFLHSLDSLQRIVKNAYSSMELMRTMDMNTELRTQFNSNLQSLKNIKDQIFQAKLAQDDRPSSYSTSNNNSGGGCYIATMAYGSYEHPQVIILRDFRDNVLSKSRLGIKFIQVYYNYSPLMVEKLRNKQIINKWIRKFLDITIKLINKTLFT
ncbi:hypothetical protein QA597_02495 [Marinilabiliaceae bacterium ANBcel2]|nr:hypothetical protein [Marinilabiliaceae bacterium ANBcel2]